MFKELRKELKSLSEEVELSASTGQEVDLDELNEDDEEVSADEQTLEEIVRLFEDEVVEMGAEDAERLMTEDDDEDEELSEDDEEESEVDKELQEMISFLEDDEVEADEEEELSEDDEEIQDKEEEAKEALAEAVNALRALRRAKARR